MVRSQIDFVGQNELAGREAVGIGWRDFPEYLVAAGIVEFDSQLASSHRLMVCAVERQGAVVDCLTGLIDRLFRRKQNGRFVFEPDLLDVFDGSEGSVDGVAQRVAPYQPCREMELHRSGAAVR